MKIKFLAWSILEKRMFAVGRIDFDEDGVPVNIYDADREIKGESYGVSACHLRQFIGRHDRHGREIYEGDIDTDGSVVVRDKHTCVFRIGRHWMHGVSNTLIDIIGNIYE